MVAFLFPWAKDGHLVAGFAAQTDRHTQRGNQVILEVVASTEVSVVQVVFQIEPETDPVVIASAESEAQTEHAAKVGLAGVVVERVTAPRQQGRSAGKVESYAVGHRRERQQHRLWRRARSGVPFRRRG